MNRSIRTLGLLTAALLIAGPAALAASENLPTLPPNQLHSAAAGTPTGIVHLSAKTSRVSAEREPVPLPQPVDPVFGNGVNPGVARQGSVASFPSSPTRVAATSFGLPRSGGAMSTPKQQADRSIARLIRKLN